MSPTTLSAVLLFSTTVIQYRATMVPDKRIFIAAQSITDDEGIMAWTKCISGSNVYVIQMTDKLVHANKKSIKFAAVHELCHIKKHGKVICDYELFKSLSMVRRAEMENEANTCAIETLSKKIRMQKY